MKNLNVYFAELMGTFFLVFSGCLGIIVNDLHQDLLGHLGIALVFGFVVMAMIYSLGNISGAHMNPAVTLGFFFAGKFPIQYVPFYIAAQFCGAILAAGLLKVLFPLHQNLGATLSTVSSSQTFIIELILSFILMFIVLNVSTGHKEKGIMAGVAIGGTIAMEALIGGPLTGASMNPARSLGPALLSRNLDHIVIYITAPCVGTFIGHPFCKLIQRDECCNQ